VLGFFFQESNIVSVLGFLGLGKRHYKIIKHNKPVFEKIKNKNNNQNLEKSELPRKLYIINNNTFFWKF
jgi:hypothetical protein